MPRARKPTAVLDDPPFDLDLPTDPEPAAAKTRRPTGRPPGRPRKIAARTPSGRIQSKASLMAQVQTEAEMYLTLFVGAWGMRDPECAEVANQQIPEIAARVVKILSRNETLLAKVADSGILGDVAMLISALMPVGRQVWRAHGPGGHGHAPVEVDHDALAARYPVPNFG